MGRGRGVRSSKEAARRGDVRIFFLTLLAVVGVGGRWTDTRVCMQSCALLEERASILDGSPAPRLIPRSRHLGRILRRVAVCRLASACLARRDYGEPILDKDLDLSLLRASCTPSTPDPIHLPHLFCLPCIISRPSSPVCSNHPPCFRCCPCHELWPLPLIAPLFLGRRACLTRESTSRASPSSQQENTRRGFHSDRPRRYQAIPESPPPRPPTPKPPLPPSPAACFLHASLENENGKHSVRRHAPALHESRQRAQRRAGQARPRSGVVAGGVASHRPRDENRRRR